MKNELYSITIATALSLFGTILLKSKRHNLFFGQNFELLTVLMVIVATIFGVYKSLQFYNKKRPQYIPISVQQIVFISVFIYSLIIFYNTFPFITNIILNSYPYLKLQHSTQGDNALKTVYVVYNSKSIQNKNAIENEIVNEWFKNYKKYYDGWSYNFHEQNAEFFWYDVPFNKALEMRRILQKNKKNFPSNIDIVIH